MNKKAKLAFVFSSIVIVVLTVMLVFVFLKNRSTEQELQGLTEQMSYEKEQLEQEYADMSFFEGQQYELKNDSIVKLLDKERERIKLLLEELRLTKATNARRIAELKKELASVRKVMVCYVNQIDSLNTVNKTLISENASIRQKYSEASQTVVSLSQEKEQLTHQVKLASMLEANNIEITTLNERERKTSRIKKTALIRFDFTILKNITAPTGIKDVFLRITTPDQTVLSKAGENVFDFEGEKIAYSCKKQIEYTGEEQSETLYWVVGEVLLEGVYRVDIFIDGNLIGSKNFELSK